VLHVIYVINAGGVMKQNLTVSIEKDLLKKGKVIAARKDTSISRMVSDLLKDLVENDDQYEAAKRNALHLLNKGMRLGGKITWRREELYER